MTHPAYVKGLRDRQTLFDWEVPFRRAVAKFSARRRPPTFTTTASISGAVTTIARWSARYLGGRARVARSAAGYPQAGQRSLARPGKVDRGPNKTRSRPPDIPALPQKPEGPSGDRRGMPQKPEATARTSGGSLLASTTGARISGCRPRNGWSTAGYRAGILEEAQRPPGYPEGNLAFLVPTRGHPKPDFGRGIGWAVGRHDDGGRENPISLGEEPPRWRCRRSSPAPRHGGGPVPNRSRPGG